MTNFYSKYNLIFGVKFGVKEVDIEKRKQSNYCLELDSYVLQHVARYNIEKDRLIL